MKWIECRSTRQEIDQAEAGAPLSAQAQRHVASCATCVAFQNERVSLRELLTSLEPVAAPADFDFRLRARIAAQAGKARPQSFFAGFALSTPAIAFAAVMVLGVSILWAVQHRTQTPTVATITPTAAREGNASTIDNSSTQSKEVKAVDPAPTTTTGVNPKVEPPIYLVKGGKVQFKDPLSSRTSRDMSAGSASSIKQGQNADDVSVSAPARPMVLSFQDDKGATRTVSLPPVSFGSQRLLESRVVPVSLKNTRDW
jgi:hypothetical protein